MDEFVSNLPFAQQLVVLLTVIASLLVYLFKEKCVGLLSEIKDSISNVLFRNRIATSHWIEE